MILINADLTKHPPFAVSMGKQVSMKTSLYILGRWDIVKVPIYSSLSQTDIS